MKTKLFSLLFAIMIVNGLSAQTYTLISRNNEDTIKLFSNVLGKAIKNIIPGSKEEGPHNFLIKKEFKGKESLLFVEFSQDEKKILTSYETDLETPGKWDTKIYTLYDIYTQLKRENAIFLHGEIIGLKVEFHQRPANFQDRLSIDGYEFPSPIKIVVLDETRKLAEEKSQSASSSELFVIEEQRNPTADEYYVAYLICTKRFNDLEDKELLSELCDNKIVLELSKKYDSLVLKSFSKGHDDRLEKYAKK